MEGARHCIVTTSWDDGHPLDRRLADLLERYGMPATFYVPLANAERPVMDTADVIALAQRFEIGGHTAGHIDLRGLTDQRLHEEIVSAKHSLEDRIGAPLRVFCYPRGRHDRRARDIVAAAGYRAARTTADFALSCGRDPFRLPTTLQAFPHSLGSRVRHSLRNGQWGRLSRIVGTRLRHDWVGAARRLFDAARDRRGVWHLWGHAWEIDARGLWADLEAIFEYVSRREDVSYLSNGGLAHVCFAGRACGNGTDGNQAHADQTPGGGTGR